MRAPSRNRLQKSRLGRSVRAVVEGLEERTLLSTDPFAFANLVQTLPFHLNFQSQVAGVQDATGQSIGFTRVEANQLGNQYQPSLIALNTAAGELNLTTTGTATTGTNYGPDNTQVNSLETEFNGAAANFTITTRLKGPLSQLSAAYDEGGVYFGPDQDNYIKFIAIYDKTAGQTLEFTDEESANTHQLLALKSIGNFANLSTLDLRLTGNAATGQITASYSVNSTPYVNIPGVVTLSGAEKSAFFNSASIAGIVASSRNSLPPITVPFSDFEINPGQPTVVSTTQPSTLYTDPLPGSINIERDTFISVDLRLPKGALSPATITNSTVLLYRTDDHQRIPVFLNSSGGGDTIILQPQAVLDANTNYTFVITNGVQDVAGNAYLPYSMTFTTGALGGAVDTSVDFDKVALPTTAGITFTCARIGPDHQLYASSQDGRIFIYPIKADGTLGTPDIVTSLQTAEGGKRLVTGFDFDPSSTASNIILWVTHGVYALVGAPDFTDTISTMSGPNLSVVKDIITGLPRSFQNHMTEQPVFHDGLLYFAQGSNTASGAPDAVWGMRSEHLLTAAILQLDPSKLPATLPLNVKTIDVPGGTYNPYAPGAPLTIYATGVRNAFELFWDENGVLWAPTNGSAAGGNTPAFPNTVNGNRIDTGKPYNGPAVPGITSLFETESDWLFAIQPGKYYGHPDPARGEYVLNGGNPTAGVDPGEVTEYPVGTLPDKNYAGYAYAFGDHRSPDGIIEYQGNAFNGALNGKLLIADYSGGDDIIALTRGPNGTITNSQRDYAGLSSFQNPLNLVEDDSTGDLYVVEYGGNKITLLRPHVVASVPKLAASQSTVVMNSIATDNSGSGPSLPGTVTITDTGTGTLTFPAGAFAIVNDSTSTTQDAAQFKISNLAALPTSLAPGQSMTLQIVYTANRLHIQYAKLEITSNDAAGMTTVLLRGIGTSGLGGANEPSLPIILRAFGIPTITGDGPNDSNLNQTAYPAVPDPSSQEVKMPRLVKAGAGPVTISLLGSFNVADNPAARFGYYTPGDPTDRTELFTIPGADAQDVSPALVGDSSFDPGSVEFGLYAQFPGFTDNGHQRLSYSEDALNTWDAVNPRKIRFFPLENPDGSIVPNAYIFACEDYNKAYDSNDVVGIIRNVAPAPTAVGAPVLGLENLTEFPATDRLIFNRIQVNDPTFGDIVHDTNVLEIHNTGDMPLVISSLTLSDSTDWQIVNPPMLPVTVPANGGTLNLTIKFIAQKAPVHSDNQTNDTANTERLPEAAAGGVYNGTLTIASNDPNLPTKAIQLAGYWQHHSGDEEEPGLQTIVNLLDGEQTVISTTQIPKLPNKSPSVPTYYGEELQPPANTGYWMAADPTLPVTVLEIAAFHDQDVSAEIDWFARGSTTHHELFAHVADEGQSLLPHKLGSTTAPAEGSFMATGAFGLRDDSNNSVDALNSDGGHHFRFYPVRGADGNIIPNTWIAAPDYISGSGFQNSDFQDNVYYITNMRPAALPSSPSDLAVTVANGAVSMQWAPPADAGLLGYNIYRGPSVTGPFSLVNNTGPVTTPNFVDTTAPTATELFYKITSVGAGNVESIGITTSAILPTTGPTVPLAPANFAAKVISTTEVDLSWTAVAGPTTYKIERSLDQVSWTTLKPAKALTGASISYADTGLSAGTTYYYRISTVATTGTSNPSPIVAALTLAAVPASPVLSATDGAAPAINFSWTAVPMATSYLLQISSDDGLTWTTVVMQAATTYQATNLLAGHSYEFRVSAINAAGPSLPSAVLTIQNLTAPPTGFAGITHSATEIDLIWNAVPSATGYLIERSTDDQTWTALSPSSALTGASTSYADTTVSASKTYFYRISAVVAAGSSAPCTPIMVVSGVAYTSLDLNATPAGSTTEITPDSAYNVTAGGTDIYGTSDGMRFVYAQRTGNFDISVQIASFSAPASTLAKAGLMMRSSLTAGSVMAFSGATAAETFRFLDRVTTNAAAQNTRFGTVSYPNVWVRLTRVGNVFTGYASTDGIHWSQTGSVTLAVASTVYVGLAVSGHTTTTPATAQFKNLNG